VTKIEKILANNGPMLSGKLGELLQTEQVSSDAARKQISRANGRVKRKGGFFINKQYFLYLYSQENTNEFYENLLLALKSSARRLYHVIHAITQNKGFMSEAELANYSCSPVKNLMGHKRIDTIMAHLIELNFIIHDPENKLYKLNKQVFDSEQLDIQKSKAIEVARSFIIDQFIDWARKIGLSSYNTGQANGEFAKFQWAYTSPSYAGTMPIASKGKLLPGFIIADIFIQSKASEDDISFFLDKLAIIRAIKGLPRFIPFLIIDSASDEALAILKKQGVVVGFLDKLFGKGYSKMMQDLVTAVSNAGAILKKNPDQFFQLLAKIKALVEGKTNNLRGDLFEMAVGYYFSKTAQSIDVGKKIWIETLLRELDVFAKYEEKVVIIECKSSKTPMTEEEAQKWCSKVTLLRQWLVSSDAYYDKRHVFELWSLGGFEENAKNTLEKASKAKKYNFIYFGKEEILARARQSNDQKFLKILNEYFIKEPI